MTEVTDTRSPPTFCTMSAKTVVVAMTFILPVAGSDAFSPHATSTTPVMITRATLGADRLRLSLNGWFMWSFGWSSVRVGGRSGVRRGLGLAVAAEPEELEPMRLDPVAAAPCDLRNGLGNARILDVRRAATALADDVMMVCGRARDICVLAARQVEPFHHAQLRQEVERPEQSGPADAEPPRARDGLELGSGEVPVVLRDEGGDGTPWRGEAVAGRVERVNDRV